MPSASPRSCAPNHHITARPLAAFTLAPSAPATISKPTSAEKEWVVPAAPTATPPPPRPSAMTDRSLKRSASRPHGSSVGSIPIETAPSTTPVSPSESRYCERSAGARAASPTDTAAKLV